MRALKLTLLGLSGLLALLVVAIVIITASIDPNDYKAKIESVVAENTTLTLTIDGDLGWSLLPLGIDVNRVKLDQKDGQPFTRLNQLTAQVGLLSLLTFNPQVHKVILDGIEVTLEKNEQGKANWENITPQQGDEQKDTTASSESKPATPKTEPQQEIKEAKELQLGVEEIAITNTTIHYIDKQSNLSVSLKDFNLHANNITLGGQFPLAIEFAVSNSAPKLDVTAKLKATISVDNHLKHFAISQLESRYTLAGEPFQGKEVSASFNGSRIVADLNKDTLSLDKVALTFANLALNTDLSVSGLSTAPQIAGSLVIPDFSLQTLLTHLGQPKIETADPAVLEKLSFSTKLNGSTEDLKLSDLSLSLDDTVYAGAVNYRSAGQFIGANIKGTTINVDRYLPPPPPPVAQAAQALDKASASTTDSAPTTTNNNQPEAPLLPLETLHALNLDLAFGQQSLIAKNLKLNDLKLLMNAKKGVISLTEASGKLYEGSFTVNGKIDATTDNPTWQISKNVDNIQILPLLQDFQDIKIISGGINLDANIKTVGNTVSALRSAAKGKANFNFDQGAFHGFNLTRLTCEGFALVNKDKVIKSDWPAKTDFQAMKGSLVINGNEFTNNNLTAALSGLALNGKGVINAETLSINYGVDLTVAGDLGDNACRVSEKVQALAIPVICKGQLDGEPAKLCGLDYGRVEDLAIALGKKELERKADKEIDKQLNKFLGDDDSETKKEVKKLFKGLF